MRAKSARMDGLTRNLRDKKPAAAEAEMGNTRRFGSERKNLKGCTVEVMATLDMMGKAKMGLEG